MPARSAARRCGLTASDFEADVSLNEGKFRYYIENYGYLVHESHKTKANQLKVTHCHPIYFKVIKEQANANMAWWQMGPRHVTVTQTKSGQRYRLNYIHPESASRFLLVKYSRLTNEAFKILSDKNHL